MATKIAEITRGSLVESTHWGNVAVVDADGGLVAFGGNPEAHSFFRSSAKPFQAVPLIVSGAADAYAYTSEEIALAAASHDATGRHQAIVRSMLEKAGLSESDLRCGYSDPVDEREKARVTLGLAKPDQVKCECSGEHAGMLAACRHRGWPIGSYVSPDHPIQREIRRIVAVACGSAEDDLESATDGCSIPTFGAPVQAFAFAYAVLSDPEGARWSGEPDHRRALIRLREAMVRHPELIAGAGSDTIIMQVTEGRVLAKLGAEGMLCLSIPDHGLGVTIVDDAGAKRSLGPAAIAVLTALGVEDETVLAELRDQLCSPVETFRGEPAGEVRPALRLERA